MNSNENKAVTLYQEDKQNRAKLNIHKFKLNACPDNASSLSIPSKHQEISCVRKVTSASNELIFSKSHLFT